jgi:hypothetical protein
LFDFPADIDGFISDLLSLEFGLFQGLFLDRVGPFWSKFQEQLVYGNIRYTTTVPTCFIYLVIQSCLRFIRRD